MKFEITKEQVDQIISQIQDAPARFTFTAINILLGLKPIEEKKEEKKEEKDGRK